MNYVVYYVTEYVPTYEKSGTSSFLSECSFNSGYLTILTELTYIYIFFLPIPTGTYLTNEAKGAEDAPDADTAIINAEGSQVNAEEKKEYFI